MDIVVAKREDSPYRIDMNHIIDAKVSPIIFPIWVGEYRLGRRRGMNPYRVLKIVPRIFAKGGIDDVGVKKIHIGIAAPVVQRVQNAIQYPSYYLDNENTTYRLAWHAIHREPPGSEDKLAK